MTCTGLLLAAGAGRRYGMPKALAVVDGTPLVTRAVDALREGGCDSVRVVVGAAADEVIALLPRGVEVVRSDFWHLGMGESLRAGMTALSGDALLIHLVDLPDIDHRVVARLREVAGPDALHRASYDGVPGHPVVVGRRWWPEFVGSLAGDQGARTFLRGRVTLVDCTDLATGLDLDVPGTRSRCL